MISTQSKHPLTRVFDDENLIEPKDRNPDGTITDIWSELDLSLIDCTGEQRLDLSIWCQIL